MVDKQIGLEGRGQCVSNLERGRQLLHDEGTEWGRGNQCGQCVSNIEAPNEVAICEQVTRRRVGPREPMRTV